jgi:hypothetical protein
MGTTYGSLDAVGHFGGQLVSIFEQNLAERGNLPRHVAIEDLSHQTILGRS